MSEFYFVVETGELSIPGIKEDSGIVRVGGYVFGKIDVGRKMALYTHYGRENDYWVTECTFLAEVEIERILQGGCMEECSVQSAEDSYVIITFKKPHSGTGLRSIEPFDFVGISERVSMHERNPYFEAIFRWVRCADDFRTEEMLTKVQRFERKERNSRENEKHFFQAEGYINRNWQKNIGRVSARVCSGSTDEGTCHAGKGKVAGGGTFFQMECMMCGEVYTAQSSSVKIKKCPNCQGGKS